MPLIEDHFDHYAIIGHHAEPAVLMLDGPDGWTLPHTSSHDQHPAAVEHVQRALREQLGLDASVLRCVSSAADAANNRAVLVHEIEYRNHQWSPGPGAQWVRAAELERVRLAHPTQRVLVAQRLQSPATPGAAVDGCDWTLPGWWDEAVAWIEQHLRQHGLARTAAIEQVRAWEFSCVLRVHTDGGMLYFKALPHSLARELILTHCLAATHPQWIAPLVAADSVRRWMLSHGRSGRPLDQVNDLAVWEHAATAYAQLQIDWADRAAELLALGCPDRRLETLDAAFEPLLADSAALLPGQPDGLSPGEIARLRDRRTVFAAWCAELAAFRIPPSIEHGDFWTSNVLVDAAGSDVSCAFIDWTDACVSHPFFSLLPLLQGIGWNAHLAGIPNAATRVRDAYLEPWTRYESRPRLVRAFELSQRLSMLHHAVSYWRLLPSIGTQWWLRRMVPFFLKGVGSMVRPDPA